MSDTATYPQRTWTFGRLGADVPYGPWTDEPDKIQWVDEATDLDCLILRNGGGALCGYVGVPESHPWHGKSYSQCLNGCDDDAYCYEHSPEHHVRVHGGLTFADKCDEREGDDHICHVPHPGRDPLMWWFGFDCAHSGDMSPAYAHKYPPIAGYPESYKTVAYVKRECASLAAQLVAVQS